MTGSYTSALSWKEVTATLEDCAVGEQGRFMLRATNMHLCHAIHVRGVLEKARRRIINFAGWRAGVRLLIVGEGGAPRHKHGSIIKKQRAVAFALQIKRMPV